MAARRVVDKRASVLLDVPSILKGGSGVNVMPLNVEELEQLAAQVKAAGKFYDEGTPATARDRCDVWIRLRDQYEAMLFSMAPRLIAIAKAAEKITAFDVTQLCGRHRTLRDPRCGECQLAARIEELRDALEGR